MIAELKRILLAEDNANDVELTLTALRENKVLNEVVVVRDGAEALDYLYKREGYKHRSGANPVLVLLDLKMPKVDGIEVLRQVKSDPQLKTIPVVVLTSSREEQDLVRTYDLGVNAYVVKPVDFHEFVEAVKLLGGFWAVVNEQPPPVCREGDRPPGRRPRARGREQLRGGGVDDGGGARAVDPVPDSPPPWSRGGST
jgi:CheY-like chemotaxis protein